MPLPEYHKLVNYFYEVGSLRNISRSYNMYMMQNTESVAEHSQRVTIIAYILALKANADASKTMLMAAFHDLPETRTGDANWHQKEYVNHNEEKALKAQLELIGKEGSDIKKILTEYKKRESIESQLAKDADNIDYVLSLKELELQGNTEAKRRLKEDVSPKHLYTKIGKKVIKTILQTSPNNWYQPDISKTSKKYIV